MSSDHVCHHFHGGTDGSRFGEPMPWVGIYVALASLVCSVALVMDLVRGLRWLELWFPSKLFIINAAMLTILGIAIKIPNDLNDGMPGMYDQLTKMSGVVFICLVMCQAVTSLGAMDGKELASNMIALGIIVVSTAVNIWVQIYTKLITTYAYAHWIFTGIMLGMYVVLVSHALSVAPVKTLLGKQYEALHKNIVDEVRSITDRLSIEIVEKRYLPRYWLMAVSSNPDYMTLSSGGPLACTSLFLSSCAYFIYIFTRVHRSRERGCYVNSVYKWSTAFIFIVQMATILLGAFVAFLRFFWTLTIIYNDRTYMLRIEKYRLKILAEWRKSPLSINIKDMKRRRTAHYFKLVAVSMAIGLHLFGVILTMIVLIISVLVNVVVSFVSVTLLVVVIILVALILYGVLYLLYIFIRAFLRCCASASTRTQPSVQPSTESVQSSSLRFPWDDQEDKEEDLINYALKLEGEIDLKILYKMYFPILWIDLGHRGYPRYLHDLITKIPLRSSINIDTLSSDHGACRSLQLATLMCIGYLSFHRTPHEESLKILLREVDEGFRYLVFIDENHHAKIEKNRVKSARMVWENLLARGKCKYPTPTHQDEDRTDWSLEDIALESMTSVKQTISRVRNGRNISFAQFKDTVAWLVGISLSKLPIAMVKECSRGSYGSKENHVGRVASMIGEMQEILRLLDDKGYVHDRLDIISFFPEESSHGHHNLSSDSTP